MALSFVKLFQPTVLGTGETVIYTAPASPATTVLKNGKVRFSNTSAGPVTVTAHAVPNGGAAGAGNCFMNAVSIAQNAYLDISIPTLAAGDVFSALASSATSITALEIGGVLYA